MPTKVKFQRKFIPKEIHFDPSTKTKFSVESAPDLYFYNENDLPKDDVNGAMLRYFENMIGLQEYLENPSAVSIAEVVITQNISLEALSVSEEQPRLHDQLEKLVDSDRESLIERIQQVLELKKWYEKVYLSESGREFEKSKQNTN